MPSQFTFNGEVVVGAKRPLWNPVINRNRNEVGKTKFNSNKHVEAADRTYGTLVKRDPETAGNIIFNWTQTSAPQREIDHGRDFVKLNKMSVHAGASKPNEVSSYRSQHDARIISRPGDILRLKNQVPVNIDKNKMYGTPSPAQRFAMSDLIRHTFETEWVTEQLCKEDAHQRQVRKREALRRASPLRVRAVPSGVADSEVRPSADGFTMKKFQNIPSRLGLSRSVTSTRADNYRADGADW
eukprot:TRINITY_DN11182_c0_g1_i1.p1 TRINITY_DN11182_c0_g1~~TRINITY_DN11182_c0_g1_i1.p1  ORF type:complete len:241 (-),score=38.92 TRINITY_DN11182_c0_g1_i1:61-783(-)